uniref:Fc receptor, IgE, high affinity I, gamma polypeptide like n=1 Tax=Neolamprologus brichardi TaxID=32507 RepID=A0A3Q4H6M0_NEOBR
FEVFLPCCLLITVVDQLRPQICYILDGILFLYGIILTALYCKVKGLTPHATDTYETIGMKK